MTKVFLPDDIEDMCVACVPVGSRVTCDPPPKDTDQDILCLLEDDDALIAIENWLEKRKWEFEGEKYGTLNSEFSSWRKDVIIPNPPMWQQVVEYNLILTDKEEWFDKFLTATVACKKANAMTKKERVAIFDKIMGAKKKTPWQQLVGEIKPVNNYYVQQAVSAEVMQQIMQQQQVVQLQQYAHQFNQQVAVFDDVWAPIGGNGAFV